MSFMGNQMIVPCSDWEKKLAATHPDDLLPIERQALSWHVASCPACATVLTEYQEMDSLIRRSLTIEHPLDLPKDFARGRRQAGRTTKLEKRQISLGSS